MAFYNTPKKIWLTLSIIVTIIMFITLFTMGNDYFSSSKNASQDSHKKIDQIINNDNFSLQFTPSEVLWLKTHPVVHLGIDRAFPPFGTITNKHDYIGFTADVMRMLEHRLGITFFIEKDAPWSETIKMAKAGQIDMIAALVNTPQRQLFLEFSPSYVNTPTIIINDGTKNGYIGSLENLNGKRVAVELGSYVSGELKRKNPDIELVQVENTSMALSLVAIGKADAYVGNAVTASYIIRKLAYHNLSFSGETKYSSNHSVGVVKSKKQLSSIIRKALNSISRNDLEAITNYWFGMRVQSFIPKKLAFTIGAFLSGILFLFSIWIISLRRAKKALKLSQEALQYQSEIDYLTGLGNRRKFNKYLKSIISEDAKNQQPFSLLFLDLDLFKEVNDSLGHALGDLLLKISSKRINQCVSPHNGFVARIGGDEFIVILSNIYEKQPLSEIAECIRSSLNAPFQIKGHEILITTSIGITRYPEDASTAKQLVINADQAMYHSKSIGRNCYSYFDLIMLTENQYKTNLIRDLRIAVSEQKFMLYYQPIIDFSSKKITKAEALIRWNHPERGFVSPAEFIPLVEETGLINTLGEWTFKKAVNDTVTMCEESNNNFQVSINTSPLQYRKNGMNVSTWCDYVHSKGLTGKNIVVEITEGILMETGQSVINNLLQLRDQNIDIAIDDFGTGYSSLSYLKKFDVDFLKIDQSFIKNMTTEPNDIALVQAIIVMAHQLGIKVIAEGIETEDQKNILVNAGCDYGQGFYFSKALSKKDLLQFIQEWDKQKSNTAFSA